MGAEGEEEGCRLLKTNSGEESLERWVRKRGRQGATPIVEGVWAVVDMVRARWRRRRGAVEEAMVGGLLLDYCRINCVLAAQGSL